MIRNLLAVALSLGIIALSGPKANATEATPSEAWSQAVLRGIWESEYHFSRFEEGVWSAPNRAQNLRSTITEDGLRVTPRIESADSWELTLRLVGVGRGDRLAVPSGALRRGGAPDRLELVGGVVTQWFVNEARGLEHGFSLEARPGSSNDASAMVLELEIGGDVGEPSISDEGRRLEFVDDAGRVTLDYRDLLVLDADDRRLPAIFEVAGNRLRIVVDDTAAVYPVVVDPLITQPDWSVEANQDSARMGGSVAAAGDVNGDGYGDVIVGADQFDNGHFDEGRVYVFHGSATGLETTPAWHAEPNQSSARFGRAVAGAGNVNGDFVGGNPIDDVIIGARDFDDFVDLDEGWVFVYYGSETGLNQNGTRPVGDPVNADWKAESNDPFASFGVSVGSAGDVNADGYDDVIVGADEFTNEQTDEGSAFVYHGSASGLDNIGGVGGLRPLGDPTNADWMGESDIVEADYGIFVASAGDVNNDGYDDVIVGAADISNNYDSEGRVYLYLGSSSGLPTTPVWTFDGGRDLGLLGTSVAAAGDVNADGYDDVIIGAPDYTNGQIKEGLAILFLGRAGALLGDDPDWVGEQNQGDSNYGISVASAGDVNGDGFDDVIVGANVYDNGSADEGAAFVYFGSSQGLSLTPNISYEIEQEDALFGTSVASAGDVDADGYDDVIIGAVHYTTTQDTQLDEGAAFVFMGCPDGDRDGTCDAVDNCPEIVNPSQEDTDGDGLGDLCDACQDVDADTVCDQPRVLIEGSGPGEEVLVSFGSSMRYLANTADPALGLSWTAFFYPDFAWPTGQYGVGYESVAGADDLILTQVADGSCFSTASCPSSVYTRTDFFIDDPVLVENMFLGVDYDDGYTAWINGIEVFRSAEMPPDVTPAWNTEPQSHESSNGATPNYGELIDISIVALPLLQPGLNTLAIGVWNRGANSSDLVLVPRLSINRALNPTMRYQANHSHPGPADWTAFAYDDSSWLDGSYGVGYEAGTGAEDLLNLDVPTDTVSVYTRASFILKPSTVRELFLGADYDDGYTAWINGVEVFRSPEMPAGTLEWNSNPSPHESSNGTVPDYEPLNDITEQTASILRDGKNVLALAVYRNDANIDDLVVVPRLSMNEADLDNCVGVANPDQSDIDHDGLGDLCDPDMDDDGILNESDNCPQDVNPTQDNLDGDDLGDACDLCPDDINNDADDDGICEGTLFVPPKVGASDNCPTVYNPDQSNIDGDALGDVCDPDMDEDGFLNEEDNCPTVNNDQTNVDGDSNGAACDCNDGDATVWERPDDVETLVLARSDRCYGLTCSESLTACGTDADCEYDTCTNFTCSETAGACESDADCEFDTCQEYTCTAGLNACVDNTDCTADTCANLACTAGLNACVDNTDCTADFCTNKICLVTMVPCNSTAECTGGPGDVCLGSCSVGANACVDDSACVADVCEGACTVGANACTDNIDCVADVCEGTCSIGANACTDDTACTAPQTDLCEGLCSIGGNTCIDDTVCVAPQTDLCQGRCTIGGNSCIEDSVCVAAAEDGLVWQEPADFGADAVTYDTLRSADATDFMGATCVESADSDLYAADPDLPGAGALNFYLIRVQNTCPESNMGTDSEGSPRVGASCP